MYFEQTVNFFQVDCETRQDVSKSRVLASSNLEIQRILPFSQTQIFHPGGQKGVRSYFFEMRLVIDALSQLKLILSRGR